MDYTLEEFLHDVFDGEPGVGELRLSRQEAAELTAAGSARLTPLTAGEEPAWYRVELLAPAGAG